MDAQKELTAAWKTFQDDISQLKSVGVRLGKQLRGKSAKINLKTIEAQVGKLEAGMADAANRYYDRVDAVNASVVQKIRALCSLGAAQGAGNRLLLDECKDFEAAKGFKERSRIYDGILNALEAVADASLRPIENILTTRDSERPTPTEWRLQRHFGK